MDRRTLPPTAAEPDMAARAVEIRAQERDRAFESRNDREVEA